ncbi:MAG: hypothetical protein F6J87_14515 [Spirulina sp. SIO3F2]|nr:hypothetical protein [Spirulina sp. SIO3F2]
MSTLPPLTSTCRLCRHYSPQGRRGGMCQRLGGLVQSSWQACQFASCPFAGDSVDHYGEEIAKLEQSVLLAYPAPSRRSPAPTSGKSAA